MELVEEFDIKNYRESNGLGRTLLFHKIEGFVFCPDCGNQLEENKINGNCTTCGCKDLIRGDLASTIAGYLKLDKEGLLKRYYNSRRHNKSAVRMNNKRVIHNLLIRDGLISVDDKNAEEIIKRIMWKKV